MNHPAAMKSFKSKVDWWIYAICIATFLCCVPLGLVDGDFMLMTILGIGFVALEIFVFASIKYAIKGDKLGVRCYCRWSWYPIDKISEVRKVHGILSAPACSTARVAIRFSDKRILKSSMPLEISPIRRDEFISTLKEINPSIIVKQ